MQIHLQVGNEAQGPFALEQINERIRAGQLNPSTTTAWYEGAAGWGPLSQIPGVEARAPDALPVGPPVLPSELYTPPSPVSMDGGFSLIPTKNGPALLGYYLGVFGLLPFLGFFLAIPGLILGLKGRKGYLKNPSIRGNSHAWTAIILSSLSLIYHLIIIGVIAYGIMTAKKSR